MIEAPALFALAGAALFALGLAHLVVRTHAVRRILALNIMGSGVFLVMIALAKRAPNGPDPVPQAMVLTGIVVAVSATAVGLFLANRIEEQSQGDRTAPTAGPTPTS
jgi:multicomponent Na+:H+ antiporter subunit C